jgi:hypothetical protein
MAATDDTGGHDRWAATYDRETAILIAGDLARRRLAPMKDPEVRWLVARKAALLRRIRREKLI